MTKMKVSILLGVTMFTFLTPGMNADSSECTDLSPKKQCEKWKSNGRCDRKRFQSQCPATCGVCETDSESTKPVISVEQCTASSGCECGNVKNGFTTYTFKIGEHQRCFTVFHPPTRADEQLPVVLTPDCYAEDRLTAPGKNLGMSKPWEWGNQLATRYGYIRIGLSTSDGHWTFGNNNIINDELPMPCSDEDSKDITYLKTIFSFMQSNPDRFDSSRVYVIGFSQNAQFAAYTAYCFPENVVGVWQGGAGMELNGQLPYTPNRSAQCTQESYEIHKKQCIKKDPCKTCKYFPIYPCYIERGPMVHCISEYTNDDFAVQQGFSMSKNMYQKATDEGQDARLLRFSPSADGSIVGGHVNPTNGASWWVGCLGITAPCPSRCEDSFIRCIYKKDVTTAKKRSKSFGECTNEMQNLDGCTEECAPTYKMLAEGESPVESSFSNFGAASGEHVRPETSKCLASDAIQN